jgi:hypothetical protein
MRDESVSAACDREADRRSESGSAYLVVLMLLVVLTIIGLSLSVVTQTEVIIGGSEKQSTRQLYAAMSGVHMQVAYEMVGKALPWTLTLATREETLFGQQVTITDMICTLGLVPVTTSTCNLCMMNQDSEYKAASYGVTTAAVRHGDSDYAAIRQIGATVALEPWKPGIDNSKYARQEALWDEGDDGTTISSSSSFDPADICREVTLRF